jgi:hypothetical protein
MPDVFNIYVSKNEIGNKSPQANKKSSANVVLPVAKPT